MLSLWKSWEFFFDCTAILCDYCELASHKSEDCPLLSATKSQIITHGYSDEKLFFFECLATKSYRPKLESTRNGTITISDGELSIPQVVSQLRRLVPSEDFQWEVSQIDHNVFKTTFPSKMEVERMKIYGTFLVPNTNIKLSVDQWVPSVQPTYVLPEVWVYVSGIPLKWKGDFLAMWALGSLFGKTLDVDMPFTREQGVLRILIGCLDQLRIPDKMSNVFFVDGFYDLTFEREIPEEEDPKLEDGANDPNDHNNDGGNDKPVSGDKNSNNDLAPGKPNGKSDQNYSAANAPPSMPPCDSGNGMDVSKKVSQGVVFSPQVKNSILESKEKLRALAHAADQEQGGLDCQHDQDQPTLACSPQPAASEEEPFFSATAEGRKSDGSRLRLPRQNFAPFSLPGIR
jgi:hypothetical protein